MDKTVLDLAKDGKISDFADVVKAELKKKLSDNEYVQQKTAEMNKYSDIADTTASITAKYGDVGGSDDSTVNIEDETSTEDNSTEDETNENTEDESSQETPSSDEV